MVLLVYELNIAGPVSLETAAATDCLCRRDRVLDGDYGKRGGNDCQNGFGISVHELFFQKWRAIGCTLKLLL